MLDVVDRGREASLRDCGDPVADLLSRQPAVGPNDADDRNVDFRKDVRRHFHQDEGGCQKNEQRHHQERVWPPQRNFDDPHQLDSL